MEKACGETKEKAWRTCQKKHMENNTEKQKKNIGNIQKNVQKNQRKTNGEHIESMLATIKK